VCLRGRFHLRASGATRGQVGGADGASIVESEVDGAQKAWVLLRSGIEEYLMATTHKELTWERDFEAALERGGGKHLLVDFSAAPM